MGEGGNRVTKSDLGRKAVFLRTLWGGGGGSSEIYCIVWGGGGGDLPGY